MICPFCNGDNNPTDHLDPCYMCTGGTVSARYGLVARLGIWMMTAGSDVADWAVKREWAALASLTEADGGGE